MSNKPKSPYIRMKELRADLHYYQQMARVDTNALKATVRKCKEIGKKLRELQKAAQCTA